MWIKHLLAISIVLINLFSNTYSQENCDNGIDDDGDGLIDLNDQDCECTYNLNSLITNFSFEDTVCCPATASLVSCSQTWIQASDATSDLQHTCGFMFEAITNSNLINFPDGDAIMGGFTTLGYHEYISKCITTPLWAGVSYTVSLYVGGTGVEHFNGAGASDDCEFLLPVSPNPTLRFGIYGDSDCDSLLFSGLGCPPSNFELLGSVDVPFDRNWHFQTMTFTPTTDVYGLLFGPDCDYTFNNYPYGATSCNPYMVYDKIVIAATDSLNSVSITSSGSLCTSDLILNAASQISVGELYQWYTDGISIIGETQPSLNVSALGLGAGIYQVVVSNNNGCVMDGIEVQQEGLTIVAEDAETCKNTSIIISASGAENYTWAPSTGLSSEMGEQVEAMPDQTTTYTIEGEMNGCTGTKTITITVLEPPLINAQDTTICQGSAVTLNATGAHTYEWAPPTGLSATSGSSVDASPQITTIYTIVGTDANNCKGSTELTLNVLDSVEITVTDDQVCFGETGELHASGAAEYSWSPEVGLSDINGADVYSNVSQTTTYTVTGTNEAGCSGSGIGNLIVVDITPYSATVHPSKVILEEPLVNLNVTPGNMYTWMFEDGSTSHLLNFDHLLPHKEGNQEIILSVLSNEGCSDTTHFIVCVVSDIYVFIPNTFTPDGNEFNNKFKVIISGGYDVASFQLEIYNRWGELIWESFDVNAGWDGTFNGQDVAEGVYTWTLIYKDRYNSNREELHGHVNLIR